MISIKNLSKSFGKNHVLKDINLTFEKGQVYGIVGENGSGKTTLFKSIAQLETYDGEITSPFQNIKNHIGFLQTHPVFMSHITGWEYLKLLCVARDVKEDAFHDQNIFDLPLQNYAENYSTGMKKKLSLMGVLLQNNDIFILDEPFNGVDIYSNVIIIELIKALKKKNKIIVISSHIFATLFDCCDHIHKLNNGVIEKSYDKTSFVELENEMHSTISKEILDRLIIK